MKKELFENELVSGMQQEMRKYASAGTPKLARAAECLHAALEILEEQGLKARADEVLQLLEKLSKGPVVKTAKIHSLKQLMEHGVSQRDLMNFAKGDPRATAKLNLVLRKMGLAEHEIAKFLGHDHVMSEEQAHKVLNPNEPGTTLEFESMGPQQSGTVPVGDAHPEFLEFKSMAAPKKHKTPGGPNKDPVTKNWTPSKGVKALKEYGIPMAPMKADDCVVQPDMPLDMNLLDTSKADFESLMQEATFDADDDQLLNMEVPDDALEVSDSDNVIEDFEDERD